MTAPCVALLLASCSGTGTALNATETNSGTDAAGQGNYPGSDIGLPPVADGFTRYETTPITVPPDQDVMWEEWVGAPIDSDMDVVSVTGKQSLGGHHALLMGTTNVQAVGTSRAWQNADQLAARTLGSVGAEGTGVKLPAGVVFRVAKGSALMIQSHFINTGRQSIQGRTVLDVKLAPADPSAQVASLITNGTLTVSLAPNASTTLTATCKVQKDMHVLMYANHMHNLGMSASTQLVSADGTTMPLKVDPKWDSSWAFQPNYTTFSLESPALIPAGSTLSTTCTWFNSKNTTVMFPDEMCTFNGFYLGQSDANCIDGQWL
jgi:hypothetical protein